VVVEKPRQSSDHFGPISGRKACSTQNIRLYAYIQASSHIHDKGKVHGDIRAFNMVFGEQEKGWLIDLDFGGKANERNYPGGFQFHLADGYRNGEENKPIQKSHDLFALWKIIEQLYVSEDTKLSANEKVQFICDSFSLSQLFQMETDANEASKRIEGFLQNWEHVALTLACAGQFAKIVEPLPVHERDSEDNENENGLTQSPAKNANTKKQIATGSLKCAPTRW